MPLATSPINFTFFKLDLLEISHTPKIYLDEGILPNDEWWTEEKPWGAWHKSSSVTNQKRSCYNVIYRSNEIGARDDSFENESAASSPKIIILQSDSASIFFILSIG